MTVFALKINDVAQLQMQLTFAFHMTVQLTIHNKFVNWNYLNVKSFCTKAVHLINYCDWLALYVHYYLFFSLFFLEKS